MSNASWNYIYVNFEYASRISFFILFVFFFVFFLSLDSFSNFVSTFN